MNNSRKQTLEKVLIGRNLSQATNGPAVPALGSRDVIGNVTI